MNAITVKNLYILEVDGTRVELELVKPGGIAAIEVKTDQFDTRLFPLDGELSYDSFREVHPEPNRDPFRLLAIDICIFASTGRHPTDKPKPDTHIFSGLGLMRASDILRDMYKREAYKL